MKINGTCEICGEPSTTGMRWWRGGWWARITTPVRRACSAHITDLVDLLRSEEVEEATDGQQ